MRGKRDMEKERESLDVGKEGLGERERERERDIQRVTRIYVCMYTYKYLYITVREPTWNKFPSTFQ